MQTMSAEIALASPAVSRERRRRQRGNLHLRLDLSRSRRRRVISYLIQDIDALRPNNKFRFSAHPSVALMALTMSAPELRSTRRWWHVCHIFALVVVFGSALCAPMSQAEQVFYMR